MKKKGDTAMDNADMAFQRSKIYRLFSYCFFYPDKDLLHFLSSGECLRELEQALLAYPHRAGTAVPEGLLGELKTNDRVAPAVSTAQFVVVSSRFRQVLERCTSPR